MSPHGSTSLFWKSLQSTWIKSCVPLWWVKENWSHRVHITFCWFSTHRHSHIGKSSGKVGKGCYCCCPDNKGRPLFFFDLTHARENKFINWLSEQNRLSFLVPLHWRHSVVHCIRYDDVTEREEGEHFLLSPNREARPSVEPRWCVKDIFTATM